MFIPRITGAWWVPMAGECYPGEWQVQINGCRRMVANRDYDTQDIDRKPVAK